MPFRHWLLTERLECARREQEVSLDLEFIQVFGFLFKNSFALSLTCLAVRSQSLR